LDGRETVSKLKTVVEPGITDGDILSVIAVCDPGHGVLLSQGELVDLFVSKGFARASPNKLTQQLKRLGFAYTAEAIYYAPAGRSKRGAWCQLL
ncbi:hypothetical protein VF13_39035, partial [Nostoc linckia z16]